MKYICDVCGWIYDEEAGYPEGGIAPNTKWEDLPEDFKCPLCGIDKENFSQEEQYMTAQNNRSSSRRTVVIFVRTKLSEMRQSLAVQA